MVFRRTHADMLRGSSGWPCRARPEKVPTCQTTPPTSKNKQFWPCNPKDDSPWRFSPLDRENGRIVCYFDHRDDIDYPCVQRILEILVEKFGVQIQANFGPYHVPYTIIVNGFTIELVHDHFRCPYLSVAECDGQFLEGLINRLKLELGAMD